MEDFSKKSIRDLHDGLRKGEFFSEDLVGFFIGKIEEKNKDIFSFLTVTKDLAMNQARKVDAKIKKGENIHLLAGIPLALKDNIMLKGVKCTAGSKALKDYTALYNATVVERINDCGGVILGKTNMDEFAMGSSTEFSFFGVTKNPHDPGRVPGGSSGGSAAAVAAGLCSFALGSDTGGSIRQPASFCGIVGFKPTYGAVSRYGLISMASSLDQIGPLARTVEDAEDVFNIIAGKDSLDSTSVPDYPPKKSDAKDLVIGVPKEYFIKGMDERVEEEVKSKIGIIEKEGFKIKTISLPHTEYALASYYIVMTSEISANMARYDGIKYGFSKEAKTLKDAYFKNREDSLGSEVKRRIILGTYALSAGYYDAYYKRAQKVRSLIKKDFNDAFKDVDLILAPTSPTLPFKIGEKTDDVLAMYLSDIFTVTSNLAGLPAMSMPCGEVSGLPVGIQIIGKPFEESNIFEVGKCFEKTWKQRET